MNMLMKMNGQDSRLPFYVVLPHTGKIDPSLLLEEALNGRLRVGSNMPNPPLNKIADDIQRREEWVNSYLKMHPDHKPGTALSYWYSFHRILRMEPRFFAFVFNIPAPGYVLIARGFGEYSFIPSDGGVLPPHVITLDKASVTIIEPSSDLLSIRKLRGTRRSGNSFVVPVKDQLRSEVLSDLLQIREEIMSGAEALPEQEPEAPGQEEPTYDTMAADVNLMHGIDIPPRFPTTKSDEPEKGGKIRVWFGTNRKLDQGSSLFGRVRNEGPSGESKITYGHVDVGVPKTHRFGELGNPLWKRLLRLELSSDRLEIMSWEQLRDRNFWAEISERSRSIRSQIPDIGDVQSMVYIHGYNVDFKEAAVRAAQLAFDLKVVGPTAFFSWPSMGKLSGYLSDEATIEASAPAIKQFLIDFAEKCAADKIHLIVHSMGNRGVLRALFDIAREIEEERQKSFDQVILAAPDVDRTVFLQLATEAASLCQRITMYSSSRDIAVKASSVIHASARAGHYKPYTVADGVDSILVPGLDVGALGHSYYAEAEALLHDIYTLFNRDTNPSYRQRIEKFSEGGTTLWRLRK